MKLALTIFLALIMGFIAGWHLFRSKEISDFRRDMQHAGISDEQLMDAYKSIPSLLTKMEIDDRHTTLMSLAALNTLESGKTEDAKRFLAGQAASYYVIYGPPNNPAKQISSEKAEMLNTIQKVMERSPILKAEVQKSLSNIQK